MEEFYEHIESYRAGTLDAELKAKMEAAMEENEPLKNAVENFPLAEKISGSLMELDVLDQLEKLEEEENTMTNKEIIPPKNNNKKIAKIILILAILAMMYTLFNKGKQDGTNDKKTNQIYAMGYERPVDPDAVKSVKASDVENPFARGKLLFALNRFEDAESAFQETLTSTENNDTLSKVNYWLTHVYMNQQEWEEARKTIVNTQENEAYKLREILAKIR